jgi:hypothetical protein
MATLSQRFHDWLADNPDEAMLRWIFRSVVTATIAVLAIDLAGQSGWITYPDAIASPAEVKQIIPETAPGLLPAILSPLLPGGDRRTTPLPQPDSVLAKPMTFELTGGGKLMATGTITPGIFESFAVEVGKRGDYIKTVVLNSPGGSVTDALAMGRLIRERKFSTEVEAGKYCASSCPLVFAGGVERRAGEKAAIGVHQIVTLTNAANVRGRDEISIAQNISARVQRYLGEMDVSLQVWVHAMETPHERLFVFKPDELKSLNLVTATPATPATPASSRARS